MKDKYGIFEKHWEKIRKRDNVCVYCHKAMIYPYVSNKHNDSATKEHLNYLPPWDNPDTVAICCGQCNSSRGQKKILDWFKTDYCKSRDINEKTVAEPVKKYLLDLTT